MNDVLRIRVQERLRDVLLVGVGVLLKIRFRIGGGCWGGAVRNVGR